jgi:hypothetical protein
MGPNRPSGDCPPRHERGGTEPPSRIFPGGVPPDFGSVPHHPSPSNQGTSKNRIYSCLKTTNHAQTEPMNTPFLYKKGQKAKIMSKTFSGTYYSLTGWCKNEENAMKLLKKRQKEDPTYGCH